MDGIMEGNEEGMVEGMVDGTTDGIIMTSSSILSCLSSRCGVSRPRRAWAKERIVRNNNKSLIAEYSFNKFGQNGCWQNVAQANKIKSTREVCDTTRVICLCD